MVRYRNVSLVLLLAAAASSAPANVVNGGFEQPNLGFRSVLSGQTFGNWTNAGPGNIEFVHAVPNGSLPNLEFSAFEGQYWIDLVGTGLPSAIFQDLSGLVPGEQYRIDWAQAGNVWGSNFNFTMRVLWNGATVAEFTQNHGGNNGLFMNWVERSTIVTASTTSSTNRLTFQAISGISARGPALDAVRVTLVPAPASLAVLAFAGVVSARRRR
jgi:hypothetical protein